MHQSLRQKKMEKSSACLPYFFASSPSRDRGGGTIHSPGSCQSDAAEHVQARVLQFGDSSDTCVAGNCTISLPLILGETFAQ